MNKINRIGKRFGRLVVVAEAESSLGGRANWMCQCDCGNTRIVRSASLSSGFTKSCGCLGREQRLARNLKHGKSRRGHISAEYTMFLAAKKRAKKKGLPFTIKLEDISIPETCPILKKPLELGTRANHEYSPSLDRKKDELGYTPQNTWVISYKANRIKNNSTLEELEMIVRALKEESNG